MRSPRLTSSSLKSVGYQLRLSTLSGLRSALVILCVTTVMIPIRALIDKAFSRDVVVDWKASLIVGCSMAFIWYVGICASTFVDIHGAVTGGNEDRQSFPAAALITGIYGTGVLISAVLSVGLYRERDSLWMQMFPLGLSLIAFYGWPRTIHCDSNGLWQCTRLGFKRYIPYEAVIAMGSREGITTVTGESFSIAHTQYHTDSAGFQKLLETRAHKRVY